MATKDWKKSIHGKNIWFDRTAPKISIVVKPIWLGKGWQFLGRIKSEERRFKTKSQALVYAKAYMRKH